MDLSEKKLTRYQIGAIVNLICWLNDIIDEDYQDRVWIRMAGPEWDSFYECSLELGQTIDVLLKESDQIGFSDLIEDGLHEFNQLLDETDVEHADGTSRGGYEDKAPDWLKLKKQAGELIPKLAKHLVGPFDPEVFKVDKYGISAENLRKTVENPICGFSPDEKKALLKMIDQ